MWREPPRIEARRRIEAGISTSSFQSDRSLRERQSILARLDSGSTPNVSSRPGQPAAKAEIVGIPVSWSVPVSLAVEVEGLQIGKDSARLRVTRSEERRVGKECRSRWS